MTEVEKRLYLMATRVRDMRKAGKSRQDVMQHLRVHFKASFSERMRALTENYPERLPEHLRHRETDRAI